jgi:hypothetical protein
MDRSRLSGGNRNPSNNPGKRLYDKINHVDRRYDLELWQQLEREVEANRQLAKEWEGSPESILSFCLSGSRNSNIPRSGEVERFPSGSSAIAHGRDSGWGKGCRGLRQAAQAKAGHAEVCTQVASDAAFAMLNSHSVAAPFWRPLTLRST